MKKAMPYIISNTQSAFISERQMLDPILIANKAVEDCCAKKKKGWILKLDLEKIFDRVDWTFLERTLTLMESHPEWVIWIMGCITSPKFPVFINGRPRERIPTTRGIRQGDPYHPFYST